MEFAEQNRNHQLSILENPYVITRITEYLSEISDLNVFNPIFDELHAITELARNEGVLSLDKYLNRTNNVFIKDFISLILESIQGVTGYITYDDLALPSFLTTPKIIYGKLVGIEFINAVLAYESIIMTITGYNSEIIDYRLNSVIGK